MTQKTSTRLLMVCLGNICRSPTAEAVVKHKVRQLGLPYEVDSAGTHSYHKGKSPDPRSIDVGQARGYDFTGITSRRVQDQDFADFDLILAMDHDNLAELKTRCPAPFADKLRLFLADTGIPDAVVPDPYYGGLNGFERVLDLIEQGADTLLDRLATH